MTVTALIQGFILGGSMIIPIGAQNSHILGHGIKRNHHLLAASICTFCDVLLITIGVFGGHQLLTSNSQVATLITYGGIFFLLGYGALAFKAALNNQYQIGKQNHSNKTKIAVIITTLAVTLLNPHVYLDTVMILGSVGSQFVAHEKLAFALGTMLASILWFYSLALGASKLAPWLGKEKVQRVIDISIGCIMWFIAWKLYAHQTQ
ncbi:LysE family transporter [uncultured Shewanella sp.]|uniref:LysE/ArgO family amino acid transporter n=1 Tax=uncultured Shewanella sp. TaxID=173975 RepID=UPI00260CCAB8|nr:LysE family transporter [uncultured Shewanella sp.]